MKLIPDYPEILVGTMIRLLFHAFNRTETTFHLKLFTPSEEKHIGADALAISNGIDSFLPFYLQFKRPFGWSANYFKPKLMKDRYHHNPRVSIAKNILYFELRNKKATHPEYQHNILLKIRRRLEETGVGSAAYICPIHMHQQDYEDGIFNALTTMQQAGATAPQSGDLFLQDLAQPRSTRSFYSFPILQEHIVVPPHRLVNDHKHCYSFANDGTDLCFHSEMEFLRHNTLNLYSFLRWILVRAVKNQMINTREDERLYSLNRSFQDDLQLSIGPEDYRADARRGIVSELHRFMHIGYRLKEDYDIWQCALVKLKKADGRAAEPPANKDVKLKSFFRYNESMTPVAEPEACKYVNRSGREEK